MKLLFFRGTGYLLAGTAIGGMLWVILGNGQIMDILPFPVIPVCIAGGVISMFLLYRAYNIPYESIRINPPWAGPTMDMICILASAMAVYFILDGYSGILFGLKGRMADPLVADVIAFMFVPANLLLALVVTTSVSQSITIDKSGLGVRSAFGSSNIAWEKIEKLHCDTRYIPVSRLGFTFPARLRTNLEIITSDHEPLTIYQPGLKATARKILARLDGNAPKRLANNLGELHAAWL